MTASPDSSPDFAQVRAWLQAAQHVAVLTGAGMSAESGIPTFRDAQTGLWARFNPAELATEEGFRAQPELVWNWYAERRAAMAQVEPNAGHYAIAAYQQRHPGRLTVITQNVDGLHQKAGSTDALTLHGNIFQDRWLDLCFHARHSGRVCAPERAQADSPPRCPDCGNMLRPDVVWFGEMLPPDTLHAAEQAAQRCDLMLVVGTSGEVYPAAGLAHQARRAGAKVVVVNPHASELDGVAHRVLRGTAAQTLPSLLADGV